MITNAILCALIILNSTCGAEHPDLTFIYNNLTNEYICVSDINEVNTGIGWIYPIQEIKEQIPQVVTHYIPKIENNYNCSFSRIKPCKNWNLEGWQFTNLNLHNFGLILDTRWEELPTFILTNSAKKFENPIEISNTFRIGFSTRTEKGVEIYLCEGWNPNKYPCYYVNIGGNNNDEVFLKKYKKVSNELSKNDFSLSHYKGDLILLQEEWKHFEITLDKNGFFTLVDITDNKVLLNYTDIKKLKPIYMFVGTRNTTALWKIHTYEYIFSNKPGFIQLGPKFNIYGHVLCVSLYVSMCQGCKMTFYISLNGQKRIIREISNNHKDYSQWQRITLIQPNVFEDNLKIYLNTTISNNTAENIINTFWAIDEVRICSENEIKMILLLNTSISMKTQITCQFINFPAWRPIQNTISSNMQERVEETSSKPMSIKLTWRKPIKNKNSFLPYYLIKYEGRDTCAKNQSLMNIQRIKSQGYVITRSQDIIIKGLIPYTHYFVTLSNIIEKQSQSFEINTASTDLPSEEEIPKDIKIYATDTTAYLQWKKVRCNQTYGTLINQIVVKNENKSIVYTNIEVSNSHNISNLLPFSNYILEIICTRKYEYITLHNTKKIIKITKNFTTFPAVAIQVQNFEVYSTDKNSASLRYELPQNAKGTPKWVRVRACNALLLNKCTINIEHVKKCSLWDKFYCTDIYNLTKGLKYSFHISIKNDKTSAFSNELSTTDIIDEKTPAKPTNLSYKLVKCGSTTLYCNMNITWFHPFTQNATITFFEIFLKETSFSLAVDISKNIHSVLKINDKKYQPIYSYLVTYIPFNTIYEISVRSANDLYKSEFVTKNMTTATKINNNLYQAPQFINCTNTSLTYKLQQLDRSLNFTKLIVIVQDYENSTNSYENIKNITFLRNKSLCKNNGNTWIAELKVINNLTSIITIGDNAPSYLPEMNKNIVNNQLQPNKEYCLTFIFINQNSEYENFEIFHEKTKTNNFSNNEIMNNRSVINPAAYIVPIIITISLAAFGTWLIYKYLKKTRIHNQPYIDDHIYETMPFDDYLPGSYSNHTYNKLVHEN